MPACTPPEPLDRDFWSGTMNLPFEKEPLNIKRSAVSPAPESTLGNSVLGRESSDRDATYTSRQENSNPNMKLSSPLGKLFLNFSVSTENPLCTLPLE